jgi:hypothetical protein
MMEDAGIQTHQQKSRVTSREAVMVVGWVGGVKVVSSSSSVVVQFYSFFFRLPENQGE